MIKNTFIDLLKNYNKTFELYANNKYVGRYNLVPLKETRELWIMDIDSIISEYSDLYNVEIGCSEEYDKFAQVTNQVWLYGNSEQQNRICECIERVYHTAYPPKIAEFVDKLIKPYHFVSLDNFLDILSEESSIPVMFADLEEKLETFQWKDRNAVTIQLMERYIGNSGGNEFFAIHEDFHNTGILDTDYKHQFENHFGKDNLRYDMIRGWDSLSYFNHSNMTFVYEVSYPNYTAYCPRDGYAVSSDGSLIKSVYEKENNMRDIKSGRNLTMPRYNDEGKIWSDSLGEYVWEKVEYKDGDTYHWDDVNLLYWNDNGDEEDYLMITTDDNLPRNCTPIKNSRKPIKSSQAKLHSDNMEDIRERLENAITQSSVETLYDDDYCFITVTQKNHETGNESEWSFCVDFGTNKVQMLEPVEDEEGFTSDNEVYRIIKNFLNGGSSREKRMSRPDYDSGEPIKVTGRGNKIGSAKHILKSGYYDDPVNHPEGGGVCDYCGAEIAPGDGYEEDFDSTWEEARSQLYAALTDDEPYNAPQSEWEFASWLSEFGEEWSDDDVHDILGEIVDMAYRGGKYPRYMCPDCNRKRIKEAAEKWVEENW